MIRIKSKQFVLRGVAYGDEGTHKEFTPRKYRKALRKKSKQARKFAALYGPRECRGCPFPGNA